MNLTHPTQASRSLSRPLRGDAEPWQYVGFSVPSRSLFDPRASRAHRRQTSLKVNAAGLRTLLNVLRIR
jgi:hypothetical protein